MPHRLHLRPLRADDHLPVQALFARQGWPQRSRAGWDWALFDAPERRVTGVPAGWVLESAGGVVGFLGNLPQRLWCQGRPVTAATCTALLVDAAWRGQGGALLRAFSTQTGTRLLYSATANPLSAPLYRMYRYQAQAAPGLDEARRWVADGGAFLGQALQTQAQRLGLGAAWPARLGRRPWYRVRRVLGWLGWPAAPTAERSPQPAGQVLRWQPPPGLDMRSADTPLPGPCGDAWQAWWAQMLVAQPGLQADRRPATLAWRLADPDLAERLAVWLLHDAGGRMQGLALARAVTPARPAAPRVEILDWCVLPDAPLPAQATLLAAVGDWAAHLGLPFMEAKRFTGVARQQLAALGGRVIGLPGEANWCVARPGDPPLEPADWSMTGIDSDDWFCSHREGLIADPVVPASAEVASAGEPA